MQLSEILQRDSVYSTQFLPVVTYCRTLVQSHNQDIDINIVKILLPLASLVLPFYSDSSLPSIHIHPV